MSKSWVLITGGAGGIGAELAREFARHGHSLILVDRDVTALDRMQQEILSLHHGSIELKTIALDLLAPKACSDLFSQVVDKEIEILVNNAGFGLHGNFADSSLERETQMLRLNCEVLTTLTKLFLKKMLARKQGRILNISSTGAFQPGPTMAVYFASKSYVLSFSEALAEELSGTGVTVTALCPGPTQTQFAQVAGATKSLVFQKPNLLSPVTVARTGYRATMKGRRVVIVGLVNRWLAFNVRLLPRRVVVFITRLLSQAY